MLNPIVTLTILKTACTFNEETLGFDGYVLCANVPNPSDRACLT